MSEMLVFYFDQTRCMGCNACAVSCKDWNFVRQGPIAYRKVTTAYKGDFPSTVVYNVSSACHHCETPKCVSACGAEAITKRADGIVIIDRNKCVGLQDCVQACPYGAIGIANDMQEDTDVMWGTEHPAQKCNMCHDRIDSGKQPACVGACPQRALDVGTLANLKKKYGNFDRVQDLQKTGPNFYIKKRA